MNQRLKKTIKFCCLILFGIGLTACATNRCESKMADYRSGNTTYADPIEPVNRAVFVFNETFDQAFLAPAATAYDAVLPQWGENAIHNFLTHIQTPVFLANDVLQGDLDGADKLIRRFVVNTALGLGGVIDVAGHHDLSAPPEEDFGQTLAVWGVGPGIYVVLPFFGPSTLRDASAMPVDTAIDPFTWYVNRTDDHAFRFARQGVEAVDFRARNAENINDLRSRSIDTYATLRTVYSQQRSNAITDGQPQSDGQTTAYDDLEF